MISKDKMLEIGNSYIPMTIKTDVIDYDIFTENHMIEFKLSVLGVIYSVSVKPEKDNLTEDHVIQIWQNLFSSFFADLNKGLSKK